jgi:hypothetical protein
MHDHDVVVMHLMNHDHGHESTRTADDEGAASVGLLPSIAATASATASYQ